MCRHAAAWRACAVSPSASAETLRRKHCLLNVATLRAAAFAACRESTKSCVIMREGVSEQHLVDFRHTSQNVLPMTLSHHHHACVFLQH